MRHLIEKAGNLPEYKDKGEDEDLTHIEIEDDWYKEEEEEILENFNPETVILNVEFLT